MADEANSRLKELRKALNLSQDEIGSRIGTTKGTISKIELGQVRFTEQNMLAICREFRVRREWLEDGDGEMFEPEPTDQIDQLVEAYRLGPAGRAFLEALVSMPEEQLEEARTVLFNMVDTMRKQQPQEPPQPQEEPPDSTSYYGGLSDDELRMKLEEEIARSKREKGSTGASSSIA